MTRPSARRTARSPARQSSKPPARRSAPRTGKAEVRPSAAQLAGRYARIAEQLRKLFAKTADPVARMATAVAVLHHKMPHFFWTGFYLLKDGALVVGPYQGPLACAVLKGPQGVCWAAMQQGQPVVVPDVHAFDGHVACDTRSRSEVVLPLHDAAGRLAGVLDVDSNRLAAFTKEDVAGLARITGMIFASIKTGS